MTSPNRINEGLDDSCLLYTDIFGEASCFQAVLTANGTAFKSIRPVHTDQAVTSAGGAVTKLHLCGMELKSSVISQPASFCLQVFHKKIM